MRVSGAQVRLFSDDGLRRFEDRCVDLVRRLGGDAFAGRDDAALLSTVRERREAAARYGFTGKRDVYRFLNLSLYLGVDFESRPELSWAVDLLRAPDVDLGAKVERIVRRWDLQTPR